MADKLFNNDLPDSERDKKNLQPDEAILDLPDVKDIPGQEYVHVPDLKEMADTTISSDDEEGAGIFGGDDEAFASERLATGEETDENDLIIDDENEAGNNDAADITEEEKKALERTEDTDSEDNEDLYRAELDDTDLDGEKLNENIDVSGDDLDVPGAEDDDADEEIGEEDEENNAYSLGDNE